MRAYKEKIFEKINEQFNAPTINNLAEILIRFLTNVIKFLTKKSLQEGGCAILEVAIDRAHRIGNC